MINCQDFHSIFRGFPMREVADGRCGGKSGKKPFCRSFGELCYSLLLLALFSPHPSILLLPQPPYYLYIIVWLENKIMLVSSSDRHIQSNYISRSFLCYGTRAMYELEKTVGTMLAIVQNADENVNSFTDQTYNSNTPSLLNSIWRQKNDLFRFPKERHIKDILKGLHRSLNCA